MNYSLWEKKEVDLSPFKMKHCSPLDVLILASRTIPGFCVTRVNVWVVSQFWLNMCSCDSDTSAAELREEQGFKKSGKRVLITGRNIEIGFIGLGLEIRCWKKCSRWFRFESMWVCSGLQKGCPRAVPWGISVPAALLPSGGDGWCWAAITLCWGPVCGFLLSCSSFISK